MENKIANNLSIPVYVYLTQICSTSSLFLQAAHYKTQLYLNVCYSALSFSHILPSSTQFSVRDL